MSAYKCLCSCAVCSGSGVSEGHCLTGILKLLNTICPGVAGLVSWTAVSSFSVFICRVKTLPLGVTMVMVSSESVACIGVSKTSLS